MKKHLTQQEALMKLQQICSRQEKCTRDAMQLLKKWGVGNDDSMEIIQQLQSGDFINNARYAGAFARDKVKFDHWGRTKVRFYLLQKGISEEACKKAIEDIDPEQYKNMIEKELIKKKKSMKGPAREIWAKLARYGTSRGYEMELMRDILDSLSHES